LSCIIINSTHPIRSQKSLDTPCSGGPAEALWRRYRAAMALLWHCCGALALLWCCCGTVVALLWRCSGAAVTLWRRCGAAVVLLRRSGAALVPLRRCCGASVALLWCCCGALARCGAAATLLWRSGAAVVPPAPPRMTIPQGRGPATAHHNTFWGGGAFSRPPKKHRWDCLRPPPPMISGCQIIFI
jgi:hypothetical protein